MAQALAIPEAVGSPHRDSNSSHPLKALRAFFFAVPENAAQLDSGRLTHGHTPPLVLSNKKACHWGRPGDGVSKARSLGR